MREKSFRNSNVCLCSIFIPLDGNFLSESNKMYSDLTIRCMLYVVKLVCLVIGKTVFSKSLPPHCDIVTNTTNETFGVVD